MAKNKDEQTPGDAQDIAAGENTGATPAPTDAEAAEGEQADDQTDGELFSEDDESGGRSGRSKRGRITKRQKIVVGVIGFLFAGSISIGTIVQGPLQFLQFAQWMHNFHFSPSESFGDKVSGKFVIYALSGKSARGRLGAHANRRADRWEKRLNEKGLKSVYQVGTQRGIGYQVTDPVKAKPYLDEIKERGISTDSTIQSAVDIDGNRLDNVIGVDTSGMNFRDRNRITKAATRALDVNRIRSQLGARLLNRRSGTNGLFHPLRNRLRRTADNFALDRDRRRQERENLREDERKRMTTGSADTDVGSTRLGRLRQKFGSALRTARGPAAAVALVCGAKGFSESIDAQNLEAQMTMLRMGITVAAMGGQIQSFEDLSLEELGHAAEQFHDPETDTYWFEDPRIQAENGEEATGVDYVAQNDALPGSKEKPALLDAVESIPTRLQVPATGVKFGPDACDLITETGEFVDNLPLVGRVMGLVDGATDLALSPTGKTKDEWIQWLTDRYALTAIEGVVRGSLFGGMATIGSRLAAGESAKLGGGAPLTTDEERQNKQVALEERKSDLTSASLYDRNFNIFNSDSLASTALFKMPKSRADFTSAIARMPSSMGSMFTNLLSGTVFAQAPAPSDPNYGFFAFGFTQEEQNDPRFDNPFEVGNYFYDNPDELERLNGEYGDDCYGMTITTEGNLRYRKVADEADLTDVPGKCIENAKETDVLRYRFYLAYTITAHTLDCYEGLDEGSCDQLYGKVADDEDTTAGGVVEYDTVGCPTTSVPMPDTAVVQGIRVHRCIAGQINRLMLAAKAAGLPITGGGWRSMERQIELRIINHCPDVYTASANACSPPTARPGTSLHERGLAIDFNCSGNTVSHGDPCWNWLVSNAATYGLSNLPSEAWHWSTSGH